MVDRNEAARALARKRRAKRLQESLDLDIDMITFEMVKRYGEYRKKKEEATVTAGSC